MLKTFEENGQAHIFAQLFGDGAVPVTDKRIETHYPHLTKQLRSWLAFDDGCGHVGLKALHSVWERAKKYDSKAAANTSTNAPMLPYPADLVADIADSSPEVLSDWRRIGMEAIKTGTVAALVLGGGQGTRLGFDKPKGIFDVGLLSHKSLFQIQAERLKKIGMLAGATQAPLWFVMTSPATHDDTVAFFRQKNHFDIDPERIFFFQQLELPCFTPEGLCPIYF